jgi:hypothetical protein
VPRTTAAAAAVGFGGRPERPRLRLISWRPLKKNTLRGFLACELPSGLRIFDLPVHLSRNGPWTTLPGKPLLDRDGRQKTDINGKPAFAAVLQWRDKDLSVRFSAAVIAALLEKHPDALGDGGAP